MNRKLFTFILLFFSLAITLPASSAVNIDDINAQTQAAAGPSGANFGKPRNPMQVAALIINSFLSILGTLFIVCMVYGGYKILLSRGQEEDIKKGQHIIRNSIIGVLIILSAYGISRLTITLVTGDEAHKGTYTCIQKDKQANYDPLEENLNDDVNFLDYCEDQYVDDESDDIF